MLTTSVEAVLGTVTVIMFDGCSTMLGGPGAVKRE